MPSDQGLIDIVKIRTDGGTQIRGKMDLAAILDYVAAIFDLPPLDVFFDGKDYWLADGFHRIEAHKREGVMQANCIIHQGTVRDAILFAFQANQKHGIRLTQADKRRGVLVLLNDPEWSGKTDRWIADVAGVDHHTVKKYRDDQNLNHFSQLGNSPTAGATERFEPPVIAVGNSPPTILSPLQQAQQIIDGLCASGRQFAALLREAGEYDTKTKRYTKNFMRHISPLSTVDAANAIVRYLEHNRPVKQDDTVSEGVLTQERADYLENQKGPR